MNKETFEILKHIKAKNQNVPYLKVVNKFKNHRVPNAEDSINALAAEGMISVDYRYETGRIVAPLSVVIMPKGKEYIEARAEKKFSDWFARTLSIIAIVIALGSLIVAIAAYLSKR